MIMFLAHKINPKVFCPNFGVHFMCAPFCLRFAFWADTSVSPYIAPLFLSVEEY